MDNKSKAFLDHLDVCRQCSAQPFNLCATGERLLQKTMEFRPNPVGPVEVE